MWMETNSAFGMCTPVTRNFFWGTTRRSSTSTASRQHTAIDWDSLPETVLATPSFPTPDVGINKGPQSLPLPPESPFNNILGLSQHPQHVCRSSSPEQIPLKTVRRWRLYSIGLTHSGMLDCQAGMASLCRCGRPCAWRVESVQQPYVAHHIGSLWRGKIYFFHAAYTSTEVRKVLKPDVFQDFELKEKTVISHNVAMYVPLPHSHDLF